MSYQVVTLVRKGFSLLRNHVDNKVGIPLISSVSIHLICPILPVYSVWFFVTPPTWILWFRYNHFNIRKFPMTNLVTSMRYRNRDHHSLIHLHIIYTFCVCLNVYTKKQHKYYIRQHNMCVCVISMYILLICINTEVNCKDTCY